MKSFTFILDLNKITFDGGNQIGGSMKLKNSHVWCCGYGNLLSPTQTHFGVHHMWRTGLHEYELIYVEHGQLYVFVSSSVHCQNSLNQFSGHKPGKSHTLTCTIVTLSFWSHHSKWSNLFSGGKVTDKTQVNWWKTTFLSLMRSIGITAQNINYYLCIQNSPNIQVINRLINLHR